MSVFPPVDEPSSPPRVLAQKLGVSIAAVELARSFDIVDMAVESYIPTRLYGYDVLSRHGTGLFRGYCFGHFDIPRATEVGVTGAAWSITTNPFRTSKGRWKIFLKNLEYLRAYAEASDGTLAIARTLSEYTQARAQGAFVWMLSVQGANCIDGAPNGPEDIPDKLLTRATLLHLTNSQIGTSSSPWGRLRRNKGLSSYGRTLVEKLNASRIFVDLAHASPTTFWDAVDVHSSNIPVLSTHTGVQGVCQSWRNLDDDQIRAIAHTGGVVGIIYSSFFLVPQGRANHGRIVVEHMNHAIRVAGEEHVGIGSDYDGFIVPPPELRSADSYPRLVQYMLDDGWSELRIQRVLGGNFLRAFGQLRPE